jgi:hypothetical protein
MMHNVVKSFLKKHSDNVLNLLFPVKFIHLLDISHISFDLTKKQFMRSVQQNQIIFLNQIDVTSSKDSKFCKKAEILHQK